jgi:hypothetical protein
MIYFSYIKTKYNNKILYYIKKFKYLIWILIHHSIIILKTMTETEKKA